MIPTHTVRFEIAHAEIIAVFRCHAPKGDPFCRMPCTMDCDLDECHGAHLPSDHGKCMFVNQMEDDGIFAYVGDRTALRSGMIIPQWNQSKGGIWEWVYPRTGEIFDAGGWHTKQGESA